MIECFRLICAPICWEAAEVGTQFTISDLGALKKQLPICQIPDNYIVI
jgi:hypothetical protein